MTFNEAKLKAFDIFHSALEAVEPISNIKRVMQLSGDTLTVRLPDGKTSRTYDLSRVENIWVVGCGKAGFAMASGVEQVLGERIKDGCVAVKYGHLAPNPLAKIRIIEAAHPEPDQAGLDAATQCMAILKNARERDLVIALISGGGTALWTLPPPGISLNDLAILSRLLLESGADIFEMNTLRKHISCIQGGFAAVQAYPANVMVLVVSDVIGDDCGIIASGPFSPDNTKVYDAIAILERYKLTNKCPNPIIQYLSRCSQSGIGETPKPGEKVFNQVTHYLIATNLTALQAAAAKAGELGFETELITDPITGEVKHAAFDLCKKIKSTRRTDKPICVISGGETTVKLGEKHGVGGRNQEFALVSAGEIDGLENVMMMSCGTDGTDGPTDATGALIDGSTIGSFRKQGIDYKSALGLHDSYAVLNKIGALIKTGPTFTNVMDIQISLIF